MLGPKKHPKKSRDAHSPDNKLQVEVSSGKPLRIAASCALLNAEIQTKPFPSPITAKLTTTIEAIIPTASETETPNILTGIQPSGGERLIDLLKKIGANTKSKFNGDYIILLHFRRVAYSLTSKEY